MNGQDLKNSILQLAIQGKLVEQRKEEGTAKELLEQIKAEKEQLIKEKKIKKEKPLPEITDDEIPFDIPKSWEWVRLVDLADTCETPFADGPFGSNLKREHYVTEPEVRIIQLSNIGENGWKNTNVKYTSFEHVETIKRSKVNIGDIVIAKMMPAGRAIEVPDVDNAYVLSSDAVKFVPHKLLYKKYLLNAINSSVFRSQIYAEVQGITRVRTSLTKLKKYLIPLPPFEEQKRIVAKIEETKPYVEKYNKAYSEVEELNKRFPEDMQKSILQYAIQGKLVEQREEEGTAEELYQQIQGEKKKLIKEGKIKKTKDLPGITIEDLPFDIPKNWKWVRLGNVLDIARGGSPRPIKAYLTDSEEGINWIKIGDTDKGGKYINSTNERIIKEGMKKSRLVKKGDFLLSNSMSFGRPYILNIDGCIHDGWLVLSPIIEIFNKDFLYYLLSSNMVFNQFSSIVSGAVVNNLNSDKVRLTLVPVPPLKEQKRIVEKIEELLPYVKQLVK